MESPKNIPENPVKGGNPEQTPNDVVLTDGSTPHFVGITVSNISEFKTPLAM